MSENATPEERTEMPTPRRMTQLRKKGTVHFSQEIGMVLTMLAAFFLLRWTWDGLFNDIKYIYIKSFSMISNTEPLTIKELYRGFIGILYLVGPDILIIVFSVATVATLSIMLQTQWNVKEHKVKFDFQKLNPIQGLKKVISINGFVNTAKALLKLCIILPIGYFALRKFAPEMIGLIYTSVDVIMNYLGDSMIFLFWKIMYVLFAFAIFDYGLGKISVVKN